MMESLLLPHLDLLATAPDGVARLRELILSLAVQGKLVPQDPADEPASVLLERIAEEKQRLVAEGRIRKSKPLPAIAEDEQPFELPAGWKWVRLDTLLQKIGAGSTPRGGKSVYVNRGIKFLRSQNIWNDGLRINDVAYITPEIHKRMNRTVVQNNDLLFNITGASIGRCAMVPENFDQANISQHVTIIRTAFMGINSFLHNVLISPYVQHTVMDVQVGVSREGLSIAKLRKFIIPIPPLAEQSRIVARVEELMRLCDALEEKGRLEATQHARLVGAVLDALAASRTPAELAGHWQRVASHFDLLLDRPEAVDALEQTILQLAVRGLLVPQDPADEPASVLLERIAEEKKRLVAEGKIRKSRPLPAIAEDEKLFELPHGWQWVRVGEIADSRLGKMLDKNKNTGKKYPYLRNTNVQWGHIDLNDIKQIKLEPNELKEFRLIPGDLLICEGGYPGRCAIWSDLDIEMYFQKALHRVRAHAGISTELIAIALENDSKSGNLDVHFTGATIKHFVGQALDRYVLPLPPLAEQSRIVARVKKLRRLCIDLRQHLAAQHSVHARLADALVQEVI